MPSLFPSPLAPPADEPACERAFPADTVARPAPPEDAVADQARRRRLYLAGLMQFLSAYPRALDATPQGGG